jgi:C1A family cysteine protease
MNIRFIFYFFIQGALAYTSQDCVIDGQPNWLCDYMNSNNRNYSSKTEMFLRKSKLLTVKNSYHSGRKLYSKDAAIFGLTSRSDRFRHELKRNQPLKWLHHKKIWRPSHIKHVHLLKKSLPPIDWRNHHGVSYVSDVKDQGVCGDCFAFASATVLEYWSKINGQPKSLSAQNIMDCTSGTERPNVACEGGLMEYVFEYAKKHPVTLDADFPYKESNKKCPTNKLLSHVKVNKYKVLMHDDNPATEQQFESILHNYGPISVGVDSTTMDDYKSGIFKASQCTTDIDHAVTIVGYTKDAWIVKNSWGPNWGESGYFRLERGKNACGIAEYAVYVESAEPVHKLLSTKWKMIVD